MRRTNSGFIEGYYPNQVTNGEEIQAEAIETNKSSSNKSCCTSTVCLIVCIVATWALIVATIIILAIILTLDDGGIIPIPSIPAPITPAETVGINKCYIRGDQNYYGSSVFGLLHQDDLSDSDQLKLAQLHAKLQSIEDYGVNPRLIPTGNNNYLIKEATYEVRSHDHHVASLEITDRMTKRYSIDPNVVPKPPVGTQFRLENVGFYQSQFTFFAFSFRDVTDQSNTLLTTENCTLVLMDKYLQMDFKLPSQRLYGLGERVREFPLKEGAWTMWAKGQESSYDDGTGGGNGYGVHPFMLVQTKNPGDYVGMFFRNSNAQSPLLTFQEDGTSTLHYITTGGNIEVYFFLHKPAKQIIQMYHNLIGKPTLPPFWALGWGQGSQKYRTTQDLENMIKAYSDSDIPLEIVYLDRSYLSSQANFQVDKKEFPVLQLLAESLHSKNQKLVASINPALSFNNQKDSYVKEAINRDALVKSVINSDLISGYLVSKVEGQGMAVFLDWFSDSSYDYIWQQGLNELLSQVSYDGLWLDLNEVSTLCDGECPETLSSITQRRLQYEEIGSDHSWFKSYADQDELSTYNLPFISGYQYGGNYDTNGLSLNATHYDGELEYNLHSLNGHMMSKRTYDFMVSSSESFSDTRPFILTRSSFSGTGKYASHSLSNNQRSWDHLRYSISGMMNFNMFGFPHVGADICGFYGEERDDEMCARWIQLSTFYPLAMARENLTYYGQETESSEPYLLSEPYKSMARDSIFDRYQYLRHMYTCLFEVSQQGGTCIDPLFYYYPNDDNLYTNVEESFLVGGAIMVSPILMPLNRATAYQVYFPEGDWVNLQDWSVVKSPIGGSNKILEARNTVQAHLRPGSMIPFQDNAQKDSYTTTDILQKPIHLIFNRDSNGLSEGSLFLDYGLSISDIDTYQYYEYYKFLLSSKAIHFFFTNGTYDSVPGELGSLKIVNAADLSLTDFACYMDSDFQPTEMTIEYSNNVLTIKPSQSLTIEEIRVIYFGQEGKDLNLCNPQAYQYRLVGSLPDLQQSSVSLTASSIGAEGILPDLQLELSMLSRNIINIKASYAPGTIGERTPFTVPLDVVNPQQGESGKVASVLSISSTEPLKLEIKGSDGTKVLDIQGFLLNSWLNIVKYTAFSDENNRFGVSGLGQRVSNRINYQFSGVYSLYNREAASPLETGKAPGNNLYGTDPFFFFTTSPYLWTGVYSNTLQAQDWYIADDFENILTDLTSIAIGGIIDLYVITALDPNQLISDLHKYILGKPALPPVYALGWHQSDWGYRSGNAYIGVYELFQQYQIPLDGLWSDIDYMDNYRSFTLDRHKYRFEFHVFLSKLKEIGLHYIPVVESGISYRTDQSLRDNYFPEGEEQQLYIKANQDLSETYIGEGWPNEVAYLDWFNYQASPWWRELLSQFNSLSPFDGIWLNRNEVTSSCKGACRLSQISKSPVLSNLLYVPTARDLNLQSIALEAVHANSQLEVDTHNLFGVMETQATKSYFDAKEQRAFIISRSQTTGMGKYGGNWLGDDFSNYNSLEASLPGIMLMNIFGIPLTGTNICGYMGDTTPDLCLRWTMVGTFFPLARNHNDYFSIPQEPYQFKDIQYDDDSTYMDQMRIGITNRYSLIKYYYTQFFLNSMFGTGAFFKPVFFEFPEESDAYQYQQFTAMLGPALKLTARTDRESLSKFFFYFPTGYWCDIFRPELGCLNSQQGLYVQLSTRPHEVYVHLYQGHIIPMQDASSFLGEYLLTTRNLTEHPVDFHVLGSTQNPFGFYWYAQGTFINDDGEVYHLEGNYNHYEIAAYREQSQTNEIIIKFNHMANASSATDDSIPDCTDVNKNDILGDVYFYNAEALALDEAYSYSTTVFYIGNKEGESLDVAVYDQETKRVILKNSQASLVCLPNVDKIVFTPLN